MARITVTMDEALWLRAREAAVRESKSLSRFVAESLDLQLQDSSTHSEIGGGSSDGTMNIGSASRKALHCDRRDA